MDISLRSAGGAFNLRAAALCIRNPFSKLKELPFVPEFLSKRIFSLPEALEYLPADGGIRPII